MKTAENKYITVAYELYSTEDGERDLVEKATVEHPFQFISGMGTTLDAFESQLTPLNKGDQFEFTIPCADAYGEYEDENVLDLPKSTFEIDGRFDSERIYEGGVVPLMTSEGQRVNGTIVEIKADTVEIDMNHPLAGAELTFIGQVVENRPATPQEIQGMLNMMSNEEGCGCGGSCGDDDNEGGCGSGGCGGGCGCH